MWSSIWYISRYLIRPLHRVGNQNINRMQTEMDGKLEKGKINKKKSTKQQNNGKEKQKSVVNRFPWVRWKVYAILGHCVRAQGWMHRYGAQDSWEETWNGKEWVRGGGEKNGTMFRPTQDADEREERWEQYNGDVCHSMLADISLVLQPGCTETKVSMPAWNLLWLLIA